MEEIKDHNEEEEEEKDEDSPKHQTSKQTISISNRSRTINESKLKTEEDDGEKHPEFSKDTIKAQDIPPGDEKKWREIELVDQVLMVRPTGEQFNIYIIHQIAGRYFRKEYAQ